MNGIWLLLWIISVFFTYGVAFGRWLEQRPKTSKGAKPKLKLDTILNPIVIAVPMIFFFTITDVVKAGWIQKTVAMRHFLYVADVVMGIAGAMYLTLGIAYIIRYRVRAWQKRIATHSGPL